ncbi:MAG: polyprenyl synthetase family protein [Candidatus Woesearchaeota archaeon]|nr:polyprenyl synthetase family protein [Candidatus Woesearchaeota archaeon]
MGLDILKEDINLYLEKFIMSKKTMGSIGFGYDMIKEYSSGGKRLRPLAMILSYLVSGGNDKKSILQLAIFIELYHTYTLILDDIMDEDEYRRNKPTVYARFKEFFLKTKKDRKYNGSLFSKDSSRFSASQGILFGNLSGTLSRLAVHESNFSYDQKIICLLQMDLMDKQVCEGQSMDIYFEKRQVLEKEYLEMISKKTGALFAYPMKIGSILAGVDENKSHLFFDLGMSLGLAFQIRDDLLDLTSNKGHEIGSDIRNQKNTILLIKTLENIDSEKRRFIDSINPKSSSESVKRVISFMEEAGALTYAKELQRDYQEKVVNLLNQLNLSTRDKDRLNEFISMMVD